MPKAQAKQRTFKVVHDAVGNFYAGETITDEQAGPQLQRLLDLGAIQEITDVPATDKEQAPAPETTEPQS